MALKFVVRFASILFLVLLVVALGIEFFFSKELTTTLWIVTVPIVLAIPILVSVVLATDDELNIPSS